MSNWNKNGNNFNWVASANELKCYEESIYSSYLTIRNTDSHNRDTHSVSVSVSQAKQFILSLTDSDNEAIANEIIILSCGEKLAGDDHGQLSKQHLLIAQHLIQYYLQTKILPTCLPPPLTWSVKTYLNSRKTSTSTNDKTLASWKATGAVSLSVPSSKDPSTSSISESLVSSLSISTNHNSPSHMNNNNLIECDSKLFNCFHDYSYEYMSANNDKKTNRDENNLYSRVRLEGFQKQLDSAGLKNFTERWKDSQAYKDRKVIGAGNFGVVYSVSHEFVIKFAKNIETEITGILGISTAINTKTFNLNSFPHISPIAYVLDQINKEWSIGIIYFRGDEAGPPNTFEDLMSSIRDQINTLHKAGYSHNDIAVRNLLFQQGNKANLIDCGLFQSYGPRLNELYPKFTTHPAVYDLNVIDEYNDYYAYFHLLLQTVGFDERRNFDTIQRMWKNREILATYQTNTGSQPHEITNRDNQSTHTDSDKKNISATTIPDTVTPSEHENSDHKEAETNKSVEKEAPSSDKASGIYGQYGSSVLELSEREYFDVLSGNSVDCKTTYKEICKFYKFSIPQLKTRLPHSSLSINLYNASSETILKNLQANDGDYYSDEFTEEEQHLLFQLFMDFFLPYTSQSSSLPHSRVQLESDQERQSGAGSWRSTNKLSLEHIHASFFKIFPKHREKYLDFLLADLSIPLFASALIRRRGIAEAVNETESADLFLELKSYQLSNFTNSTPSHINELVRKLLDWIEQDQCSRNSYLTSATFVLSLRLLGSIQHNPHSDIPNHSLIDKVLMNLVKTNTFINLRNQSLGPEELRFLARGLKLNASVISIDVSYNQIGNEAAIALADALRINASVTFVNLSCNQIGSDGAIALGHALEVNTSVTSIVLSVNLIGNEGAVALAEALKVHASLTSIDVPYNQIGNEGAIALAAALKINTRMASVNVSSNRIGNLGAIALAEALKVNASVTSFDFCINETGNEGAIALAEALKINTRMTSVNVSSNRIGNEGGVALAEALKVNTSVTSLNLSDNQISNEGAIAVAEALKINTSLTSISLLGNTIDRSILKDVDRSLRHHSKLLTILLDEWKRCECDFLSIIFQYLLPRDKLHETNNSNRTSAPPSAEEASQHLNSILDGLRTHGLIKASI